MNNSRYKIRGIDNQRNRRNKSNTFIVMVIITLILLIIIYIIFNKGIGIKLPSIEIEDMDKKNSNKDNENIYNKNKGVGTKDIINGEEKNTKEINKNVDPKNNSIIMGESMDFFGLQYGVFKNEDNAKKIKDTINSNFSAFIVKEDDLYKVISGVYLSSNIDDMINKNKSLGIECSKIRLSVDLHEDAMREIGKITDGSLKILNKLNDSKIKCITTKNLKQWVNKLNNSEQLKKSPNYSKLNEIKNYISTLPLEINRKNLSENYKYIYTFLKGI